jgi:hypothetical protein
MTDSAVTGEEYFDDEHQAGTAAGPGGTPDGEIGQDARVAEGSASESVEDIADEVREDIRLGHVDDDVSHVLEERLEGAGITMRPEDVDELAEEIERDAST